MSLGRRHRHFIQFLAIFGSSLSWLPTIAAQNAPTGYSHKWSKRLGTGSVQATGVVADRPGNVIVTGTYGGTVTVGGGILPIPGFSNSFVAKYSGQDGSHLWSRAVAESSATKNIVAGVDGNGDVVVVGTFSGTINLGGVSLVSAGGLDFFAVKYSTVDGAHIWSQRYGGSGDGGIRAVAIDSGGSVLIAGTTSGNMLFAGQTFSSAGETDIFVGRISGADGTATWGRRYGSSRADAAEAIAIDGGNNIVVVGYYNIVLSVFGPTISSRGGTDGFIIKLAGDGNPIWWRTMPGTGGESALGVTTDGAGNPMVVGTFENSVDFGGGILSSAGLKDIFVIKFSSRDGLHLWSRAFGSTGDDECRNIATESSLDAVLAGSFVNPIDFGAGFVFPSADDIYLLKLSGSSGLYLTSKQFGGTGSDLALGMAIDVRDNMTIAGQFTRSINLGGETLSGGFLEPFLAGFVRSPLPSISQGGIVSNASFATDNSPLAPGAIAAIFGENLNDGSTSLVTRFDGSGKLVTTLGGAEVRFNGIPAPMFYSTPGQIGVQVPYELAGQNTAAVHVLVSGQSSAPRSVALEIAAPGIFTTSQNGRGAGVILHGDGNELVTADNPAKPGETVVLFATGLGAVTPSLASGAAATGNATVHLPTVLFDGIAAEVMYSGAAPGFVGLNQVNIRIPQDVRIAPNVPLVMISGTRRSNSVTIATAP